MSVYTKDMSYLRKVFAGLPHTENKEQHVKDAIDQIQYQNKLYPLVMALRQISIMLERGVELEYIAQVLEAARGPWLKKVATELRRHLKREET